MVKRWMFGGILGVALVGSILATGPQVNASSADPAFTIGDGNSAPGTSVEFWGAQWSTTNSVSDGAPSSFKGLAVTVTQTGTCSGTFTATPGGSSAPPATVPSTVEVLVVNAATKSGSVISGTFTDEATVATNPGYGPNPADAGTGTVVALCSQGGGSSG